MCFSSHFLACGIAALGSIVHALVTGRVYGAAGVGVYALGQSILVGISILSRQGMDNALMKYIGKNHAVPEVPTYLFWALRRALLLSVPSA